MLLFSTVPNNVSAQGRTGVGISGNYNFQNGGIGAGIRLEYIWSARLIFSPQLDYYFPFNQFNELYAGMAINYAILPFGRNGYLYVLGGGYYNMLLNYASFNSEKAKLNNFAVEAGAGIARARGCLRPFLEQRYDFKWKEANIRLGIMLYFGACSGNGKTGNYICPAYK
ncbi:MAG: hypothetical protein COC01_07835 [Bacteroidetes bacterium]|nr:hypothetical protein [Sphingobacteriaceae bacterium AH-315-L07]PCH66521.1 MAG: hypothetical protein COC01_07835 [Bacteroidota bacterium]